MNMNLAPLKHFRVEFRNYAPVSGKPLNADLMFSNRVIATFQSLDRKISYHHQNYNLHSTAYDYDGFMYQILTELNDQIFAGFALEQNPQKLNELFGYLMNDNRFMIPVSIIDKNIMNSMKVKTTTLPALISDAVKVHNTPAQ